MSVRINGKPFDFDSNDWYAGEQPNSGKLNDYLIAANLLLWGYIAYPAMVKGIKLLFSPMLHYFNIPS